MKRFAILLAVILLISAALRFYELDLRPNHHDESVHSYFSYLLYSRGHYEGYNPAWHGPLQYYMTSLMYRLIGDSDLSGRVIPAILGILTCLLPAFLRRQLGDYGALAASFMLCISPSLLYYSRFFREDMYIVFFSLAMVVCAIKYLESGRRIYLYLIALLIPFSLAAKENAYIILFIFTFSSIMLFLRTRYRVSIKPVDLVACTFISFVTFYILYSYFLAYPLDPFYAPFKALFHWSTYKSGPSGPFFFYVALILLYNPLALFFTAFGIHEVIGRYDARALAASLPIIPAWIWIKWNEQAMIANLAAGLFFALLLSLIILCVKSKNPFPSFICIWVLMSLMLLSMLHEKAPWLLVHIILPSILLSSWVVGRGKGKLAFILLSSFVLYSALNLNYVHFDDPAEPMIQAAQPRRDFKLLLERIDEVASMRDGFGTKIQMAKVGEDMSERLSGTQITQFLWYLRKYSNISWGSYPPLDAPIILCHGSYADEVGENLTSYSRVESATMRWYWFEPEDFLSIEYLLFRKMNRDPDEDVIVMFYR